MNYRNLAVALALMGGALPMVCADEPTQSRHDIDVIVRQGRGTAAGRAAWDRLSAAGPALLPRLLEAMDTKDIVAINWLRTAFDQVTDRALKAGSKDIDVDGLLKFVKDARRQGRARRLALELVERLRPGTSQRLYAHWLNDPEFRYEAVALTLTEAKRLARQGDKRKTGEAYRQAFAAAHDMMQLRQAAAGLHEPGSSPSVAAQMGFLVNWYIVGPFDGMGMKGFQTSYPPEKRVDLKAEYVGQGNKKLHWIRYTAREPAYTSGDRHQALVNLREQSALGDADDAVAFAYTEFMVPREQEVEFRGAADDNFTVWVNGRREFGFEEYRNGVRHDRHRFKVKLKAGKNAVLVKVCQTPAPNPEPNWEFFLRVVDETGKGVPMSNALVGSEK